MKGYTVTVTESGYQTWKVYAKSEIEAEHKALDENGKLISEKTFDFDIEVEEMEDK